MLEGLYPIEASGAPDETLWQCTGFGYLTVSGVPLDGATGLRQELAREIRRRTGPPPARAHHMTHE